MISGPPCCANGIKGYGSTKSGIVFVGIAPGRVEMRTGRPATGPTGKLLDAVLEAINIAREDTYFTNLICWYKDDPTPQEIEVCSQRLHRELGAIQPKVIVALGALACRALFRLPLSKARGAVLKYSSGYGLATYHPAAALHTGKTAREKEVQINCAYDLVRDLSKLPQILDGTYDSYTTAVTYTVVDDHAQAQKLLDQIALHQGYCTLDVETNYDKEYDRSHPFSDTLTCIGIGYENNHSYILTPNAIRNLDWHTNQIKYTFHNGMFDTQKIARELGVWLPIGHDTMLQAYSVDERPKSNTSLLKLKVLSREYVGGDFYEEDEHKTNVVDLYQYNSKDVCYTHRLHNYLEGRQEDEDVKGYYTNILIPATEMLARSQYRGIHIDTKAADQLKGQFIIELLTLQAELRAAGAKYDFTEDTFLNSPKQLLEYMACEGIQIGSTGKAVLNELLENDEIVDDFPGLHTFISKLLRYRTLYRLLRVYLIQVTEQIQYDGRVHPHPYLCGTVTGRLTYGKPVMNTLPKPKTVKELAKIRRIFSATSDDYILLEADYAQIEAWVAAHLSGDPVLLSDLQSGNWHTNTTIDVFGVTPGSVDHDTWKFYYDGGKHLNYGFLYGEGPEGLTRRPPIGMGCDFATSKAYHMRLNARYAHFIKWGQQLVRDTTDAGYLVTPFGRRRRFPIIVNDHQKRQIINSIIQSTASDYTITSAIKLWPRLTELDTHLLFVEHDALYYEVPKARFKEIAILIRDTMQMQPLPNLPSVRVEMTVGQNLHDVLDLCQTCWEPYEGDKCTKCQ